MPDRHRRHDDIDHPLERSTDKSAFQVLNAKIAEYRALIFVAATVLAWFGWTHQSPSARISGVEREIQTVKDTIVKIRKGQVDTHNSLEVLVRLRCFDTTLSNRDMELAGLDCSNIRAARRGDSVTVDSLVMRRTR